MEGLVDHCGHFHLCSNHHGRQGSDKLSLYRIALRALLRIAYRQPGVRSRELGGHYMVAGLRRYLGDGGSWLYCAHYVEGKEKICRGSQ